MEKMHSGDIDRVGGRGATRWAGVGGGEQSEGQGIDQQTRMIETQ